MEEEIELIIKNKWCSNEIITCGDLLLEEDELDKALEKYGYLKIHRQSYGPVQKSKQRQLRLF